MNQQQDNQVKHIEPSQFIRCNTELYYFIKDADQNRYCYIGILESFDNHKATFRCTKDIPPKQIVDGQEVKHSVELPYTPLKSGGQNLVVGNCYAWYVEKVSGKETYVGHHNFGNDFDLSLHASLIYHSIQFRGDPIEGSSVTFEQAFC